MILSIHGVSSFVLPSLTTTVQARRQKDQHYTRTASVRAMAPDAAVQHTWSPQDLTSDRPGFAPIPDDDYVKQYQRNPELWPVEFFLIAYRRNWNERTQRSETQVLVRASANGTSKYGVGTGVPATRWILTTQGSPPLGYAWAAPPESTQEPAPRVRFEASNYPEFPKGGQASWTYDKIDIREDAFARSAQRSRWTDPGSLADPELEAYANRIREGLRTKLAAQMDGKDDTDAWDAKRISVVQKILDRANSVAAIQGTLRMSGLFARKPARALVRIGPRHVSLGDDALDPEKLVQSVRIFTMFPQMPDPLPLPSTPPEELQREIASRASRMAASGRDPHQDRHGRTFTHISTSNPSNTIHGVYLTLDATGLPGLDEVPALDLFGTKEVRREWRSLQDLKVLASDGRSLGTEDTKPTFISGFIVRQLVKDGVIKVCV